MKTPYIPWRSFQLKTYSTIYKARAQSISNLKKRAYIFSTLERELRFLSLSPYNPRYFRQKIVSFLLFFLQRVFLDYCCLYSKWLRGFLFYFLFSQYFLFFNSTLSWFCMYFQQGNRFHFPVVLNTSQKVTGTKV